MLGSGGESEMIIILGLDGLEYDLGEELNLKQ